MDVARKASQEDNSFADEASPPEAQPLKVSINVYEKLKEHFDLEQGKRHNAEQKMCIQNIL